MIRKNTLLLAALGLAFSAAALDGNAATCTDAKGKHYDCKVANKPAPAAPAKSTVPQSVLVTKSQPVVGAGSANKGNSQSLIGGNQANGGKIVAQGGGNIVAQGGGNIISTNGGGLKKP